MTPDRAYEIGRLNALEALDQVSSFLSLQEAIDSYWQNAGETVMDSALAQYVLDGFESVLKEHDIKGQLI